MPIEIGKLIINLNLKGNDSQSGVQMAPQGNSESATKDAIKEMIEERADEVLDIINKKNER